MSFVRCECFTNINAHKREQWPDVFLCVPRIGDRVTAKSGFSLKVVGVTHGVYDEKHQPSPFMPYVLVELNR